MLLLSISVLLTLVFSLLIQPCGMRFARRFDLLDHPSARKTHAKATPIVGGICIFLAASAGLGFYSAFNPGWFFANALSLAAFGASIMILIVLGIVDDVRGLGPAPKLIVEFAVAFSFIFLEPHVRDLCIYWQMGFGWFVWPIAALWIVGITNALNLIDGLDGLASGTAFLVCTSIGALSLMSGPGSFLCTVLMAITLPAVLGFLRHNWNPARIFLGDNGSLPLGFLISTCSLMCRPSTKSWVLLASVILMLGYPMLDMALTVYRRHRSGLQLFKADRNHLHYRVLRLGLDTRQTATLLLGITVCLQVTALLINTVSPLMAAFGIFVACFNIFFLLFIVGSIEAQQELRIGRTRLNPVAWSQGTVGGRLTIDLSPLYEVSRLEESDRYVRLLDSLELLVSSISGAAAEVTCSEREMSVLLRDFKDSPKAREDLSQAYRVRIDAFLSLMEIQCSLSALPIRFEAGVSKLSA